MAKMSSPWAFWPVTMAVSRVSTEFVVVRLPPESRAALTMLFTTATATPASKEMPLVLVPLAAAWASCLLVAEPRVGMYSKALSRRAMGSLPATETVSTSSRKLARMVRDAARMTRLPRVVTASPVVVSVPIMAVTTASMRLVAKEAPTPTELPGLRAVAALAAMPSDLSALAEAVV